MGSSLKFRMYVSLFGVEVELCHSFNPGARWGWVVQGHAMLVLSPYSCHQMLVNLIRRAGRYSDLLNSGRSLHAVENLSEARHDKTKILPPNN